MSKLVCLSFDDGPNTDPNDHTMEKMLDLLEKYKIPGSFFLIGNKINAENTAVIKRAFDMGCDIQNHTWSHPALTDLTAEEMKKEYRKCDEAIINITGVKPSFFRAPYIATNDLVFDTIKTPYICGHGVNDWDANYGADYRHDEMLKAAKDGIIYLLHVMEGNDATLEACERIIPELLEQGYEFVTVPEMFKRKGIDPNRPKFQWSFVE